MGDPHNPARAGETWNPERLALMVSEVFGYDKARTQWGALRTETDNV